MCSLTNGFYFLLTYNCASSMNIKQVHYIKVINIHFIMPVAWLMHVILGTLIDYSICTILYAFVIIYSNTPILMCT